MLASVVTFIVGLICIILGISHTRGNISSLHSYHTNRVAEEDRLPMGKRVGLGTIICGGGIVVFGILSAVAIFTDNEVFVNAGTAVMIAALAVGLVITLRAINKYNKGIF